MAGPTLLNFSKGVIWGTIRGDYYRVNKRDTRSFYNGSYFLQALGLEHRQAPRCRATIISPVVIVNSILVITSIRINTFIAWRQELPPETDLAMPSFSTRQKQKRFWSQALSVQRISFLPI